MSRGATRWWGSASLGALAIPTASLLGLVGCLGSAPPAPPVRWFDATPTSEPRPAAVPLRFRQASTVGSDFVLRVGPRELVFDSEHRWAAEPVQFLARGLVGAAGGTPCEVELVTFEFDLQQAPTARVGVRYGTPGVLVVVERVASGRSAPELAEAMVAALEAVAGDLVARLGN